MRFDWKSRNVARKAGRKRGRELERGEVGGSDVSFTGTTAVMRIKNVWKIFALPASLTCLKGFCLMVPTWTRLDGGGTAAF